MVNLEVQRKKLLYIIYFLRKQITSREKNIKKDLRVCIRDKNVDRLLEHGIETTIGGR